MTASPIKRQNTRRLSMGEKPFVHLLWCFVLCLLVVRTYSFAPNEKDILGATRTSRTHTTTELSAVSCGSQQHTESIQVHINEFFKQPVPRPIQKSFSLYYDTATTAQEIVDMDVVTRLTSAPSVPGCPRPLWLVLLGSLPTGLLWYGYYKFAVEEEMLQMELEKGKIPRGFGGYGSVGPSCYGMLLGPLAFIFHLPGGLHWSTMGVLFLFYTQILLYERVNELFEDEGREAPLEVWWSFPIFFPFNFIVGLRQVHFLSQYLYEKRGAIPPPPDPIADFFPFIKAAPYSWQEFLLTPRLWCSLLRDAKSIDRNQLPSPLREILSTE